MRRGLERQAVSECETPWICFRVLGTGNFSAYDQDVSERFSRGCAVFVFQFSRDTYSGPQSSRGRTSRTGKGSAPRQCMKGESKCTSVWLVLTQQHSGL